MARGSVRFLVFDVESVADGALLARVRYPRESLEPAQAIARYRQELQADFGTDFIPYTYQVPISTVVAKVDVAFHLLDIVALDEPAYRSPVITKDFWRGWEYYERPTLVTFNGRSFDLPLMELAAFRYGISVPTWFAESGKSWDQPRNRYNVQSHLDLHELLVNFGATRFNGGLNLAANLLGKPGKIDVQGYMVQDLYDQGELQQINDYCRCDVLDSYFVFLRTRVLVGQLSLEDEQERLAATKAWLTERADQTPAYRIYLDNWGDWQNPWRDANATDSTPPVSDAP